jgi:hypothetical protein
VSAAIARFSPKDVPDDVWERIRPVVTAAVAGATPATPGLARRHLTIATQLAVWADRIGVPLEHTVLFHPETIDRYIREGCAHLSIGSRMNYRSQLWKFGEAVIGPEHFPPHPLPLRRSPTNTPYSKAEVTELVAWSRGLSTAHMRRNAQALLAIGLGAGPSSQEVSRLVGTDVREQDGLVLVDVIGKKARTVPVLRTWAAPVLEMARDGPRVGGPGVLPTRAYPDHPGRRRVLHQPVLGPGGVPVLHPADPDHLDGHPPSRRHPPGCPPPGLRGDHRPAHQVPCLRASAGRRGGLPAAERGRPVVTMALPGSPSAAPPGPTAPRLRGRVDRLDDAVVRDAVAMVDSSGLVEKIEEWRTEERRGPGGRPETFPLRALLVAMLLCPGTDHPVLATAMTDVLFRRISPTLRHELGVPAPPGPLDFRGQRAIYRSVRTRLHALFALMDPSPTPKNRRLDPFTYAALLERRQAAHTEEEWTERGRRLEWLINQIIEMSLRTLPRDVRRQWKGSSAVDATVVPTFARADRRLQRKKRGKAPEVVVHSADPDADWYVRNPNEAHPEGEADKACWGYEASLIVSGTDHPSQPQPFPSLVIGMATLHKPGRYPGRQAVRALASVHERGHPAHLLAGDRAYSSAKPEDFQLPLRSLGYQPVFDYKVDQLGIQGSHAGMLQIEGAWYCPAIPKVLIEATIDYRKGAIDEPTYRARLEERWKYLVASKARPDPEGHGRLRCPASNPAPVAHCDLKPASVRPSTQGRLRIPVVAAVADHPPTICSQQSITVPPEAGAKFAQPLLYGSDEWQAAYRTLRSTNEGMNGFLKDGAREALGDPQRRRIRGVAAQSVFVALLLLAANLRKIDRFLVDLAAVAAGTGRRRPRRRRTRALDQWLPGQLPPAPPVTGGPGPDPPTAA